MSLLLGSKKCLAPKWNPYHSQDGFPFITCTPQADIVGRKNATLVVAEQSVTVSVSLLNSMFQSICRPGPIDLEGKTELYFGANNELCVLCPQPGAICQPSSVIDPYSQNGFWRLKLDLTCKGKADPEEGVFPQEIRSTTTPYTCIDYNNVKQSKRAIDEERCSTNRTNHGLKDEYPNLRLRDYCYDYAACQPKDSCTGNNTCDKAYRWTLDQCTKWEKGLKSSRGLPLRNGRVNYGLGEGQYPCETDSDCRTRSGKTEKANGGDNDNLRPMDGAICVSVPNVNGTTVKRCQCKPSERCAMCTVYTHLRRDGECVPCPDCPTCLIAGLVVAGFLCCVGIKWLSAKKFNLAFINIIVDYFQVLSLFSRIKIKWPAFIQELMNLLSFFSFNIDVASPECLIPSIEYEWKYYAMMCLPLLVRIHP